MWCCANRIIGKPKVLTLGWTINGEYHEETRAENDTFSITLPNAKLLN